MRATTFLATSYHSVELPAGHVFCEPEPNAEIKASCLGDFGFRPQVTG